MSRLPLQLATRNRLPTVNGAYEKWFHLRHYYRSCRVFSWEERSILRRELSWEPSSMKDVDTLIGHSLFEVHPKVPPYDHRVSGRRFPSS